jgi:hypothetical protein
MQTTVHDKTHNFNVKSGGMYSNHYAVDGSRKSLPLPPPLHPKHIKIIVGYLCGSLQHLQFHHTTKGYFS